jgi:hypothetical protein
MLVPATKSTGTITGIKPITNDVAAIPLLLYGHRDEQKIENIAHQRKTD